MYYSKTEHGFIVTVPDDTPVSAGGPWLLLKVWHERDHVREGAAQDGDYSARVAVAMGGGHQRREFTYYPFSRAFRRCPSFGFFIDQGGDRDLLERECNRVIAWGKGRNADGSERRARPANKEREKLIMGR